MHTMGARPTHAATGAVLVLLLLAVIGGSEAYTSK